MIEILEMILPRIPTRIIFDGVDSYQKPVQRNILADLMDIQKRVGHNCKIMISSRREPLIQGFLKQSLQISLEDKSASALQLYIEDRFAYLQEYFCFRSSTWTGIKNRLQHDANGMFLWVRHFTEMPKRQMSEA